MPANFTPVFPLTPKIGRAALTAANSAMDGTGTTAVIFAAAGAFGARVDRVRCRALGTNVATVARIFLNNGSASSSAVNNTLVGEIDLPATTETNGAALVSDIDYLLDTSIPVGWTVLVCLGTAVWAGWQFTCVGGDY